MWKCAYDQIVYLNIVSWFKMSSPHKTHSWFNVLCVVLFFGTMGSFLIIPFVRSRERTIVPQKNAPAYLLHTLHFSSHPPHSHPFFLPYSSAFTTLLPFLLLYLPYSSACPTLLPSLPFYLRYSSTFPTLLLSLLFYLPYSSTFPTLLPSLLLYLPYSSTFTTLQPSLLLYLYYSSTFPSLQPFLLF